MYINHRNFNINHGFNRASLNKHNFFFFILSYLQGESLKNKSLESKSFYNMKKIVEKIK